jgi:cytochrome c553
MMNQWRVVMAAAWIGLLPAVGLAQSAPAAGGVVAADVSAGNPEVGRSKISMCIGCHSIPGYKASFPEVYSVPAIGGQNQGYLISALQAYAKGDRTHPTMRAIAAGLSEQDMRDITAYYAAQH